MLPLRHRRRPGLAYDDPGAAGADRMRRHIETVEIMQEPDRVARLDLVPTGQQRLVMAGERREREALAVDHARHPLRARRLVTDPRHRAAPLAMPDRRHAD